MVSTLQKLYVGGLNPSNQSKTNNSEYWRQFKELEKAVINYPAEKNKTIFELYNEIVDIYTIMADIEKREMFELGFNTAIKVITEAHSEKRTV